MFSTSVYLFIKWFFGCPGYECKRISDGNSDVLYDHPKESHKTNNQLYLLNHDFWMNNINLSKMKNSLNELIIRCFSFYVVSLPLSFFVGRMKQDVLSW